MKQSISGGGGGGGGRCIIPTENEVEVAEALLTLPKMMPKSELLIPYTCTWGRKKRRSVLIPESESSPATHHKIDEKSMAVEADKSPSTPLCFLPSGSGSDGGDKPNQQSYLKKNSRKRTREDLMGKFNQLAQEREILTRKIKAMENLHQQLTSQNLELKARKEEINYSRNIQDWNKSMNLDQHHYHQQITLFVPPPPPPPPHRQQVMVDSGKGQVVAMSCSGHSNSGGRLGLFNQIEPRVTIHGETFDFMASSQPLDQNNYVLMDNDLRVRTAAAARLRRIIRMKEKLSRGCRPL